MEFKILDTIEWFTKINYKHECRFLQVDICDYYSSINKVVLNIALFFSKNKVEMTVDEIKMIKLARISILEYRNKF